MDVDAATKKARIYWLVVSVCALNGNSGLTAYAVASLLGLNRRTTAYHLTNLVESGDIEKTVTPGRGNVVYVNTYSIP